MSAALEAIASELRAAFPDLRTDLTTFDSGGGMLGLWLGDQFIAVEHSLAHGFIIDDDPDAHPFNSGFTFATENAAEARDWLVDALRKR